MSSIERSKWQRFWERIHRPWWGGPGDPLRMYAWCEPYGFTRRIRKLRPTDEWRLRRVVKVMLGGTILLTLPLYLAIIMPTLPGPHGPPRPLLIPRSQVLGLVLLASLAITLSIIGLNYLLCLFEPRFITLGKKVIVCGRTNSARRWPYEEIGSVHIDVMRLGDREFTAMVITLRDGRDVILGVSRRADLSKIIPLLTSKGVIVVEQIRDCPPGAQAL